MTLHFLCISLFRVFHNQSTRHLSFILFILFHLLMKLSTSDYNPKRSIKDDLLHRKELVQSLSEIIVSSDVSNGLVIGISGKWGSGKTTVLNFIKEHIQNDNVTFIDFNPWLYSSQEELSVRLLNLLSYNPSRKGHWKHSKKVSEILKKISSVTPDHTLSELFSLFSTLLNDNSEGIPLDSLKDKISEKIRNSNRRYVVTIDDLDRLDPTEILMVFKLVRSVANFSNVIYILCYDDTIVRNALTTESYSGQEYLQKIINVPIRLPEHSPDISIQHLVNVYSDLVRRTELNDYEIGIFHQLRLLSPSIRDVYIISSTFQVLFIISNNNTCPIDLLALTFIDIKDPDTYMWISNNRKRLCGFYIPPYSSPESRKKDTLLDIYKEDKQNTSFVELISILFPKFKSLYSQMNHTMEYHISDPNYVNNYFQLTPSSLDISDSDIREFIRNDSPHVFFNLISNADPNNVSELVYRICDKMKKIPNSIHYAETFSRFILLQPFGEDNYLNHGLFPRLSPIVISYLDSLPDFESKYKFLNEVKPTDNLHKVTFYGATIHRIIQYIVDDNENYAKKLYSMISESILCFKDFSIITKPDELQSLLILISRTDINQAKQIFLQLKPDYDQRAKVYKSLNEMGYTTDFLTNLVGDRPFIQYAY